VTFVVITVSISSSSGLLILPSILLISLGMHIMAQYISYLYISRKLMIQLGGKHYTMFSLSVE
jgi:hypothetical protein